LEARIKNEQAVCDKLRMEVSEAKRVAREQTEAKDEALWRFEKISRQNQENMEIIQQMEA
jgi:hypothetical protein